MGLAIPFILIQQPRASAPHECWSETGVLRGHLKETRGLVKKPIESPIRSWPETRYARLLSGCRHAGRICWISLTLARYILSTGFRGYSGLPTLELRLRGSWACNGSSWNTPAGFELSKAVPAVMWQMGAC